MAGWMLPAAVVGTWLVDKMLPASKQEKAQTKATKQQIATNEVMANLLAQRMQEEAKYRPQVLSSIMQYGQNVLNNPRRSTLYAPGIFEPQRGTAAPTAMPSSARMPASTASPAPLPPPVEPERQMAQGFARGVADTDWQGMADIARQAYATGQQTGAIAPPAALEPGSAEIENVLSNINIEDLSDEELTSLLDLILFGTTAGSSAPTV